MSMAGSPVRFGLIGFGAWGCCHAEAIAKTPGALLAAIAAHSPESCATAREQFPGVPVYADYRELLEQPDLDLIDVVLPSHLHRDVGCAALAAGRHLLLEKPMALSVAECDDLLNTARRHNRLLAIGHEMRLSSLWSKAKQLIDEGFIGEPQHVLVELSRRPYRPGSDGWRYDIRRVGSWVLEEPIHFFDLARWYLGSLGEPLTVYAAAKARRADHPELRDNFSAIVKFPGGAYAVVSQTLSAFEHHQTVKVTGSRGALWAGWSGAMDRTLHPTYFLKAFDGETVAQLPIDKVPGELFELEDQMAMLVGAVRDGGPLAATGEDGKWAVWMCLAAEQSAETGLPVSLQSTGCTTRFATTPATSCGR
jgi:myo-inositol 2-dehydrogenase/D-chiro-inositol 1-dehydrogenase